MSAQDMVKGRLKSLTLGKEEVETTHAGRKLKLWKT